MTLYEALLLIAFDDHAGHVVPTARSSDAAPLHRTLVAAVLVELKLAGCIRISPDDVVVLPTQPPVDAFLCGALNRIARAKHPARVETWISRLAALRPDLEDRILLRLVEKGILRRVERSPGWLFSRITHPTANPLPEIEERLCLRRLVLVVQPPDLRAVCLLELIRVSGLLHEVFSVAELKTHRSRIELLAAEAHRGAELRRIMDAAVQGMTS